MATYTREMILAAASNCTTISAVARKLNCCGSKLSGNTATMLRTICPELEGILRGNKEGTSTICPVKTLRKLSPNDVPDDSENPYRVGSTYNLLFREGSKIFIAKKELIEKVAALTGKNPKCIAYSLSVLCHKSHSSNLGRSTALRDDKEGTIILIPLSRNPIH